MEPKQYSFGDTQFTISFPLGRYRGEVMQLRFKTGYVQQDATAILKLIQAELEDHDLLTKALPENIPPMYAVRTVEDCECWKLATQADVYEIVTKALDELQVQLKNPYIPLSVRVEDKLKDRVYKHFLRDLKRDAETQGWMVFPFGELEVAFNSQSPELIIKPVATDNDKNRILKIYKFVDDLLKSHNYPQMVIKQHWQYTHHNENVVKIVFDAQPASVTRAAAAALRILSAAYDSQQKTGMRTTGDAMDAAIESAKRIIAFNPGLLRIGAGHKTGAPGSIVNQVEMEKSGTPADRFISAVIEKCGFTDRSWAKTFAKNKQDVLGEILDVSLPYLTGEKDFGERAQFAVRGALSGKLEMHMQASLEAAKKHSAAVFISDNVVSAIKEQLQQKGAARA